MLRALCRWLRRIWDRLFLSDHEWKKKNCPHIYHWLFVMTPEERTAKWKEMCERPKSPDVLKYLEENTISCERVGEKHA